MLGAKHKLVLVDRLLATLMGIRPPPEAPEGGVAESVT
jgi:hypothetical protein